MSFHVSGAVHFLADQTKPVLTSVLAVQTFQGGGRMLERLDEGECIAGQDLIDMRTIQLGLDRESR